MSFRLTQMGQNEIYRSDIIRVVADVVNPYDLFAVVTFSPRTDVLTLDRDGYASNFLRSRGINAFHVITSRNHWYQHLEMPDALACIRRDAGNGVEIATYGSSMGGYAAMRFASWVGARRSVVISPQFSPDSYLIELEDRWKEYLQGVECLWEKKRRRSDLNVVLFFDPFNDFDRNHAEICRNYFNVESIPVRRAGHPAGEMLVEMGILQNNIIEIMRGSKKADVLSDLIRQSYKKSASYLVGLSYALRPHHTRCKLELAIAAVASKSDGWRLSYLASVLAAQGAVDMARSALNKAVLNEPDEPRYKIWRAMLMMDIEDRKSVYNYFDPEFVERERSAFQSMIDRATPNSKS